MARGFPGVLVVKNLLANAGNVGLIPGLGRSPGEGNSNPLKCSCLGSPLDRGTWWAIYSPSGHKELDTTYQLNNNSSKMYPGNMEEMDPNQA